jgi:hypothetical protein
LRRSQSAASEIRNHFAEPAILGPDAFTRSLRHVAGDIYGRPYASMSAREY